MSPTDQAGKRAKQVAPGAKVKLTIGTSVSGVPIVIPPQFSLRVYVAGGNPGNVTALDRWGNTWNQPIAQVTLIGLPYWNGSTEQTANATMLAFYLDFDGRTYESITLSGAFPYAFLLTDPTKPAPGLEDESTD